MMTAWQPGQPVPAGHFVEDDEDGWQTSPCSEPIEEDLYRGTAILCEACFGHGDTDRMWDTAVHAYDPTWGVATVETPGDGGWDVTWHARGLTVAQAQETLGRTELTADPRLPS